MFFSVFDVLRGRSRRNSVADILTVYFLVFDRVACGTDADAVKRI